MLASNIILSDKYKDFMKHEALMEFLEGSTAAGKTTVGALKFMLKVADSRQRLHILSGLDLGTIEKNIINPDLGILDIFGDLVDYASSGRGDHSLPHILYTPQKGQEKIIYILGYDNKKRWKKALGGQYGCLYIDEINIADMDYVREATMRADYVMATLNPDDPYLPVYSEYINHSRPVEKWAHETPKELLEELSEPYKPGWTHWYFSFKDNEALSEEKQDQIISTVPVGTKLHKNKILGLRGKATGLVFSNFDRKKHVVTEKEIREMITKGLRWSYFSCGVDTAYSEKSEDTITFEFQGITNKGHLIVLGEEVYQNADILNPLAPSDVAHRLISFLDRMKDKWGFAKNVFIDSADQATITELQKYKRQMGSIYQFVNAYKKTKIIDRIELQLGWLNTGHYIVNEACPYHIRELELYSWKEDKYEPEDKNNHSIDASWYGWLPFKEKIGSYEVK